MPGLHDVAQAISVGGPNCPTQSTMQFLHAAGFRFAAGRTGI